MARLIEHVRAAIRVRQYSLATERSYLQWVRRFVLFHEKRHPGELGKEEVEAFLTYLAVRRGVSPSTQNQALQASLFPYRNVLQMELLGQKDVKTTMIYTHVVQRGAFGARSPLDIALRSTDSRGS